jgi:hypothetical protein
MTKEMEVVCFWPIGMTHKLSYFAKTQQIVTYASLEFDEQ